MSDISASNTAAPLLQVRGLKKQFKVVRRSGLKAQNHFVRAVDGVDLTIHSGETVGLVGESGCGKKHGCGDRR